MRASNDAYMMSLARLAASRTTCIRRGVGCVLANARGQVLAIGYNGVAAGMPHCNEGELKGADYKYKVVGGASVVTPQRMIEVFPNACKGHDLPPGKDSCEAVHAEQNALLQCRNAWEIETAYVTLSPCKACMKLLLNTSCKRLVIGELHVDVEPLALWERSGRSYTVIPHDAP